MVISTDRTREDDAPQLVDAGSDVAPVHDGGLAVYGSRDATDLVPAEALVQSSRGIGLEDNVEHDGVETCGRSADDGVLDESASDSCAAMRGVHDITGIGNVRGTAGKVGREEVPADDLARKTGNDDNRRLDPNRDEAVVLQRRRFRKPVSSLDDVSKYLEESRPIGRRCVGEDEVGLAQTGLGTPSPDVGHASARASSSSSMAPFSRSTATANAPYASSTRSPTAISFFGGSGA